MHRSGVFPVNPGGGHKGTRSPCPAHGAASVPSCCGLVVPPVGILSVFTLGFCCNWGGTRRDSQHFTWLRGGVWKCKFFFCFYELLVPPSSSRLGKHLLYFLIAGPFFLLYKWKYNSLLGSESTFTGEISCLFFSSRFPFQNVSASFSVSKLYINKCVDTFTTY